MYIALQVSKSQVRPLSSAPFSVSMSETARTDPRSRPHGSRRSDGDDPISQVSSPSCFRLFFLILFSLFFCFYSVYISGHTVHFNSSDSSAGLLFQHIPPAGPFLFESCTHEVKANRHKMKFIALVLSVCASMAAAGVVTTPIKPNQVVEKGSDDCFFGVTTPQGCGYVFLFAVLV